LLGNRALLLAFFLALTGAPGAARALAFTPIPIQLVALEHGAARVTQTWLDNTTMYGAFLEFDDQLLFATESEPLEFSNGDFAASGSLGATVENRTLAIESLVSMTASPATFPDWSVYPQTGGVIQGVDLQASLPLLVAGRASLAGAVVVHVAVPSTGDPTTPLFLSSSNPFLVVSVTSAFSGDTTELSAGSIGFFLPGDELTIRVETSSMASVTSGGDSTTCVARVCALELGPIRLSADIRDAATLQLLAPVPEPGTGALFGLGLVVLGYRRRCSNLVYSDAR
jgi:hypothetical protein